MRRRLPKPWLAGFTAALVAGACGGTTSTDGQSEGSPDNPETSSGGGGTGGTESVSEGAGGSFRVATGGSNGCVPVVVSLEVTPLNLVFILDRSSSMGDTDDTDPRRWIPVQEGLQAFLSQPVSRWTYASLELFPAADDLATACDAAGYEVPTVPLLSLAALSPEVSPFQLAMDATTPSGGTPTLPALLGALNYARNVQSDYPASTTVVVLVTAGLPGFWDSQTGVLEPGCIEPLENTIANVVEVAAEGLADGIPTHVIGVDDASELGPLDEVALAGGSARAAFVESEDAATMAARLQAELAAIRTQYQPCTIPIPEVEGGSEVLLEYPDMAVVVTVDGIPNGVPQNADCETEVGFQFLFQSDSSIVPSHIELCPATCQSVHSSMDVQIDLEFPCGVLI